jgi:site-specific recombinase XerD
LRAYLIQNIESVKGQRLLLICDLMLCTGLRASEVCGLRVKDTPMVLGTDVIEVYRGKGDKDRTIQLSPKMAGELTAYISRVRHETLPRHVRRGDITQPVFYGEKRRPYGRHGLKMLIYRLGQTAGIIKRLHPHMFRHAFAVNTLLAGVDIYLLQQLMGHSSIEITAKYLHIVNAQMRGLGIKLDRRF